MKRFSLYILFLPLSALIYTPFNYSITLQENYDVWAPRYKDLVAKAEYTIPTWLEKNISFLPDTEQQVLDLGCADGTIGECLSAHRKHYTFTGVDFSKKMVEYCSHKKCYSQTIHADLNAGLPNQLFNQSYDMVIATGCLEFIQHHEILFQQINRVLKPNGLFLFTVQFDTGNGNKMILDTPLNLYTIEKTEHILKTNGFTIVQLEVNPYAYKTSTTQEPVCYLMIIAKK